MLTEALSYYEFVAHALGLKATVVELALYDLSQGVAQWVPSALLGALHSFQGNKKLACQQHVQVIISWIKPWLKKQRK